jgi:hypothetical protein
MAKILKKVQLSADPTKGTQENPYSQEEFAAVPEGTWKGGYVEGAGYVAPATRGSYPDTGNVLYPGIYVSAGAFISDDDVLNNLYLTEINVDWTSGYTGNANLYGDPDWYKSNIRANADAKVRYVSTHAYVDRSELITPVVPYWKKIQDGVYHAAVQLKYRIFNNTYTFIKEFTLEELESGHKP